MRIAFLHWKNSEALRFGLAGAANSIFGLSCIYFFKIVLAFSDVAANMIGYGLGLMLSFFLNSKWVFVHTGSQKLAALKFGVTFLVSYGVNIATILFWIKSNPMYSAYSHVAGFLAYSAVFFMLSKFWTFRS